MALQTPLSNHPETDSVLQNPAANSGVFAMP